MVLNEQNTIFTTKGVEMRDYLKKDQAVLYQSPSKIQIMGYTGLACRVNESTTIPNKYFKQLSGMGGFISLGSTGVGSDKQYKNIHIYSEKSVYLDGINRIAYLCAEGDVLKVSEYKKGTRGSRYSSLYKILKCKLIELDIPYQNDVFTINETNIKLFVGAINQINDEQLREEYVLVKDERIDELNFGTFNVAYWELKINIEENETYNSDNKLTIINEDYIKKIDECSNSESLIVFGHEIEIILEFCNSKIKALRLMKK